MTTTHPSDTDLQGFYDLSSPADHPLAAHVVRCTVCQERLTGYDALARYQAALPRDIEPPSRVWAAVERRTIGRAWRDRSVWSARYGLAAAAALLVVFGGVVGVALESWRIGVSASTRQGPAFEAEVLAASRDLDLILEASRASLDPEVLAVVERSLKTIDAAIREAREALRENPNSHALKAALAAAHDRRREVIMQASRYAQQL